MCVLSLWWQYPDNGHCMIKAAPLLLLSVFYLSTTVCFLSFTLCMDDELNNNNNNNNNNGLAITASTIRNGVSKMSVWSAGWKKVLLTSPAPFWKDEKFSTTEKVGRSEKKMGGAALFLQATAYCCRRSLPFENNQKRCWCSDKKRLENRPVDIFAET